MAKPEKASDISGAVELDHQQNIHELLAEKHACYVLITCDPPADGGEMQVKMTYEGDPILAAYLVQGAQDYMDDCIDDVF